MHLSLKVSFLAWNKTDLSKDVQDSTEIVKMLLEKDSKNAQLWLNLVHYLFFPMLTVHWFD